MVEADFADRTSVASVPHPSPQLLEPVLDDDQSCRLTAGDVGRADEPETLIVRRDVVVPGVSTGVILSRREQRPPLSHRERRRRHNLCIQWGPGYLRRPGGWPVGRWMRACPDARRC